MKNINKNMTEPVEDWETAADEITESQPVNIPSFLTEDSEFPELSATANKPTATKPKATADKNEWKTDGKKRRPKVKGQKLVLNFKSFADEQRERRDKRKEQDDERTKAFEILADKEGLQKRLTKTRMCNSVGTDEPCKHGENCRFAHTLDELVISDCFFGNKCRFIKIHKEKVYNKDGDCKCCPHKHPQETIDEFYSRTGLTKYQESTVEEPQEIDLEEQREQERQEQERKERKLQAEAEQYEQDRKEGVSWSTKILGAAASGPCPINRPPTRIELPAKQVALPEPAPSQPVVDKVVESQPKQETVLRVPKELAMQAMEMAIKMGSENIRVEII
jgi:hypothetical protein